MYSLIPVFTYLGFGMTLHSTIVFCLNVSINNMSNISCKVALFVVGANLDTILQFQPSPAYAIFSLNKI